MDRWGVVELVHGSTDVQNPKCHAFEYVIFKNFREVNLLKIFLNYIFKYENKYKFSINNNFNINYKLNYKINKFIILFYLLINYKFLNKITADSMNNLPSSV